MGNVQTAFAWQLSSAKPRGLFPRPSRVRAPDGIELTDYAAGKTLPAIAVGIRWAPVVFTL